MVNEKGGPVGESSIEGISTARLLPGQRNPVGVPLFGLNVLALILVPSYCVYVNWIGADFVKAVRTAVDASHAMLLFICVLIVGSILSVDFRPLPKVLPRLVTVLLLASVSAGVVGTLSGFFAGVDAYHALFLIVIPIMGGGLNAGALPLALGYGDAFGNADGILAVLVPSVLLGNFAAIVVAGAMGYVGQRRKGSGSAREGLRLMRKADDESPEASDIGSVVAAILLFLTFTIAAYWIERTIALPAPVFLLGLAGMLLVTNILTRKVQRAIIAVYQFSAKVFIFPVLIIVGLLYSPWNVLVAGFAIENILVVSAVVLALAGTGYLVSLWTGLDPIDGSITAVSRAAMGGTGDVAMLSAARRLDLMPFAQITTRLGGAITVFIALLVV